MKVLIIPIVIPYPLDNGGAVAQFAVLEYLQHRCDITVCCLAYSINDISNIEILKSKLTKVRFEIIDLQDKRIKNTQLDISKRTISKNFFDFLKRIIRRFDRARNTDYPKVLNNESSFDEFKNSYRINPVIIKREELINQLSDLIKSEQWDIFQTEFYEMADLVGLFPEKSKKIFVSHESRTLRLESAKKSSNSSIDFCEYIISINKLYETEILKKYDIVIVFSNDDKIRLSNYGLSNIEISAFPVLSSDFIEISPFKKLKQLVFIGGASHYPNREGFKWFVENIYPSIFEKYKLPLIVLGNWSEEFKVYSDIGNIVYKGFVESISNEIVDSVQIVPVRIGNGIRTKILVGMAMRMPIITTALGVEGIPVKDYNDIFIADTMYEYIEKIDYILKSEDNIQHLLGNAYEFVRKNYSQEEVGKRRMKIYNKLKND